MCHSPTSSESFGNNSLDLWLICIQVILVCLSFYLYSIFCYCRYPDDVYDRYWFPVQGSNSTFVQSTSHSGLQILMTNHSVLPITVNGIDYPPDAVMRTALTDTSGNITIYFPDTNNYLAYLSFYFAELDPTANATSRNYYVLVPDSYPTLINPLVDQTSNGPDGAFYPNVDYYGDGWDIIVYPDPTSPLGPLVNALEFLEVRDQMVTLTNLQDGELIIWL